MRIHRGAFRHRQQAALACLAALAFLADAGGCSSRTAAPLNGTKTPPDFALNVLVRGPLDETNRLRQTSRYVLESNRTLRATRGRGAIPLTYPPIARRLGPAQVESLVRLVARHHLMVEPTSPSAEAAAAPGAGPEVIYELQITSNGQTHRYRTTPDESPPTIRLLTELVRLAGG